MVGKITGVLIGGYVALRICIALIPSITDLDISSIGGGAGIVWEIMGVSLWLLPVAAVAGVLIWAANQISNWGGFGKRNRGDDS